ncbi:MAG: biotin--[acetyl-CoA-carboxylase] ligase [Lachnospiraceae bacterium]|nr:biotin--[acetyl-CoA-carboxylase] ligase [Lachnospiraceae bacterium]
MNTKEQILEILDKSRDRYLSGSALSRELGLTRAAVWKAVRQLSGEGYEIESSRQGYRLGGNSDALSEYSLRKYLGEEASLFDLTVFQETGSTNDYLKKQAPGLTGEDSPGGGGKWHAVIASSQTAGRGRKGRSFLSPPGTGVYLSILLRPETDAGTATRITTAAAVAACLAIEENTDEKPVIKWVNDVFIRGKKVCGILTEASLDMESGNIEWAVMGIGFNIYEPEGGFPDELKDIAGAVSGRRENDLRSRIAAGFLKRFTALCLDLNNAVFQEEYRKRCFLIGQNINVLSGNSVKPAQALDIDSECHLIVRYEDGTEEALSSGEVSVRKANDQ